MRRTVVLGGGGAAADLVGALGDAAHVEAGLVGPRPPVVQARLEVGREAQAQPHEAALGHERARRAGRHRRALQRHHHRAPRLRLPLPAPAPPGLPTSTVHYAEQTQASSAMLEDNATTIFSNDYA